jgi:hypothetical protein
MNTRLKRMEARAKTGHDYGSWIEYQAAKSTVLKAAGMVVFIGIFTIVWALILVWGLR